MEILKFDDLPQGGFAGLRERRFVMDERIYGARKPQETVNGIGNFVYLADANFMPNGETGLHPHKEIDVISVMVSGRISHAGSLEHGQGLEAGMVQVQRAGAEGFKHNEINPDDTENHMIQLWVAPDELGEPAGYKAYSPARSERMHIYGGSKDQDERFYSKTQMEIVNTEAGQVIKQDGDVMAYLSAGSGQANGTPVAARTLIRSDGLEFQADKAGQLILIYDNN
ncbi:pilus assembly protein [Sphingomonadales bacterium EhC05]|nr:pilus assembly protein [Sphingomonadales bacterium EhC05]